MKILSKARFLRDQAEELGLHGLYFQHMALCRRRAWLHLIGATHAIRHPRVQRGHALHHIDKRPDKVPFGLGISPDAIDFDQRIVIERKGGAGAQRAVSRQALFYAAYMTAASGEIWTAEVHVYGTNQKIRWEISEEILDELIGYAEQAQELLSGPIPPAFRIPLCNSCSCQPICWDDEE